MIDVRAATADDGPAVAELLGELGYGSSGSVSDRLALWTAHPHRRLLLAERAGDTIGLVAVAFTPRLEGDSWWAQVVALVVSERARERGIGGRLLERVEQLAKDIGCDTIIINSSRSRTAAQRFYLGAGYRDRCQDHAQFIKKLPRNEHA